MSTKSFFLILMLICLFNYGRAQQTNSDSTAYIKAVQKAIAYNNSIDSLSALINKEGRSNDLNVQLNKYLYECLQVPIDYINSYPNSRYSISALRMLGAGQTGSPISKDKLRQLFDSLSEEVKKSDEGANYIIDWESWGRTIINDAGEIAASSEKYSKLGYLDNVSFKKKLQEISRHQDKNVISTERAAIEAHALIEQGKSLNFKRASSIGKKLTDIEIYSKLKLSTLVLCTANPSNTEQFMKATAYVIDAEGICVTNYHVLKAFIEGPMSNFFMSNADGEVFPVVQVLAVSAINDLAVLKIDTKGKKLSALSLGDYAPEGTPVYAMGHSDDLFFFFTKGIVSGNYSFTDTGFKSSKVLTHPIMTITADYSVGASGGPVVNEYGDLIGTISHTETIYADKTVKATPQMVIKKTIPVLALKEILIESTK